MINFLRPLLSLSTSYIFLYVVFILLYLSEVLIIGFTPQRLLNLIENIAYTCAFFALINLLFGSTRGLVVKFFYAFVFIIALLEGLYFLTFNAEISASAIFIALDSNNSEAGEFFSFNFKWMQSLYLIFVILSFYLCWKLFPPKKQIPFSSKVRLTHLLVLLFGAFLLSKGSIRQYNFPFLLIESILEYNREHKLIDEFSINTAPFSDISLDSTLESQTHIVVIGESTSRLHFGLYDYKRQTTPLLNEISDELLVFDDVVSGETYTVGSLMKALVIKKNNQHVGNILQLLNQAGFKTFWLSNQPPIGIYETLVTKLALSSDVSRFLTTESPEDQTIYDAVLLDELRGVFNDPSPKKVIFLHMMGTHAKYAYRYPNKYAVFNSDQASSKQKIIDSYDNAILYNDYILRSIIEQTRQQAEPSTVLYFSDHGEEVYDTIDFAGHSANGHFTKNLVEIPFVLWGNANKKLPKSYANRPFILNDLSHSLADLYGIKAAAVDTTKSLFHDSYKIRKRIVRDTIFLD